MFRSFSGMWLAIKNDFIHILLSFMKPYKLYCENNFYSLFIVKYQVFKQNELIQLQQSIDRDKFSPV